MYMAEYSKIKIKGVNITDICFIWDQAFGNLDI